MGKARLITAAALLAALAALAACGAIQATTDGRAAGAPFGLSPPSALYNRQLSNTPGSLFRTGTAFDAALPHNRVSDSVAPALLLSPVWGNTLHPGMDDAAYCMYSFNFDGFEDIEATWYLQLAWEAGAAPVDYGELWLGLADPAHDCWQWFPGPADNTLAFDNLTPYIAGDKTLLLAVVLLGNTECRLASLSFSFGELQVRVTGLDLQAAGATGGTGAAGDVFTSGDVATVSANQDLSLMLHAVSGTWQGAAFSGDQLPGGMMPADYDAVMLAVSDALQWSFANAGATDARFTSAWFLPAVAYPGNGDPGGGTICPDDDPESTAASTPEGRLDAALAAGTLAAGAAPFIITVPGALDCRTWFDLTPDPGADVNEGYYTGPDLSTHFGWFSSSGQSFMFLNIVTWAADGNGLPNGPECEAELRSVTGADAGLAVIHLEWDGAGDNNPGSDQFVFYHNEVTGANQFICCVNSINLLFGSLYALRFYNGTAWSSINRPAGLLGCVD